MITFLLIFLLLASGCGGGEGVDAEPGPPAAPAPNDADGLDGYNVLLITIDTLRADRLGAYGYDGAETPNIDRLAAEGVRFERVTTTVPATLPAHASIMTGLQPFEHGVRNNGSFALGDEVTTLAEQLAAAGYATGGFIAAVVLDAQFGIAQGFEQFGGLALYQSKTGDMSGERPGDSVVDEAGSWIRNQPGPFFAWVHLYDPHDPYAAPEPYGSRHADSPYDGEVAYADAMVGRLRQVLEESGAADNTLIVLTADHGEALGDHGEQGHSFFIYDSTIRVPLIFWAPGAAQGLAAGAAQGLAAGAALPERAVPAGAVVAGGVGVIDIFPTVLTLLGLPVAANSGADLSRHFDDLEWVGRVIYSESLIPYLDFGWSELRALVEGNYKYIAAPEPELYDLAADPGETDNLVHTDVERADTMDGVLQQLVAGDDVTAVVAGAVDAESIAALQALGYLSGGPAVIDEPDGPRPSPRDRIAVFNKSLRARALLRNGNLAGAERLYAEIVEEDPEVPIAFERLGEIYTALGRLDEAAEAFRHVVPLKSNWAYSYTNLAEAQLALGQVEAAEQTLLDSFDLAEPVSHTFCLLGYFNEIRADLRGAIDDYEACLNLDPRSAGALAHLAKLRLQLNEMDVAEEHARAAIVIDPTVADANLVLARLHMMRDEPEQAVSRYQDELRSNPNNPLAHFDLAMVHGQEGRVAEQELHLVRVLEIDPTHPRAALFLAQLYIKNNKNYQQGVDLLSAVLEQPMSTEDLAASYAILADLHQRLGNSALTREFRQKARNLRSP
ncbi:MAG: sulfatase-like hydrolase/transferase [Acidobacteria bacterium]|nr:sulfatase-like hydrolase/transferase [Acidobacteriota bacterium]